MKFLIFSSMLIAAVVAESIFSEDQIKEMKVMSKECMESSHVDPDLLEQARQKHFHDDQNLKEYVFCAFKKMHWIDGSGHMQKDTLQKQLGKSTAAKEAMEACVDKKGDNGPDTAYVFVKCFLEHLPAGVKGTL